MKRSSKVLICAAVLPFVLSACGPLSEKDTCEEVRSILKSAPDPMEDQARERMSAEFKSLSKSAPESLRESLFLVGNSGQFENTRKGETALMGDSDFDAPWDVGGSMRIIGTCGL